MLRRSTATVLAILCGALASNAVAQQRPTSRPASRAASRPSPDEPVDETEQAAGLLRDLLGLTPVESRPTDTRRTVEVRPHPQDPRPTTGPTSKPAPEPGETRPPQDPDEPPRVDDADRAARLLRELLGADREPRVPGQPPVPRPDTVDAPALDASVFPVHGSLSWRFRARRTARGDESDRDFVAFVSLDLGDEQRNSWTAHFAGRGYLDSDRGEPTDTLNGIEETFDSKANARVYDAWIALHEIPGLQTARVGRQTIWETPEIVYLDGVRLESERFGRARWWAGVHVGVPTHLYESTTDGDFLAGTAIGCDPWSGGRLRFDSLHVSDQRDAADHDDDLLGMALWQRLGSLGTLHARHTWLDGEGRDLELRTHVAIGDGGPDLDLTYRELLTTQRATTTEFDPFSASAFDERPYRQLGLRVGQPLGDDYHASGGLDVRRLSDRSDDGPFNREFDRAYLTASADDLFDGSVSASITAEVWNSDGEDTESLSGDVRWQMTSRVTARLGTSYYLYRYDSITNRERDHVRVYEFRLDHRPSDGLRFDARYEYERDDFDEYHTLRAGMAWTF